MEETEVKFAESYRMKLRWSEVLTYYCGFQLVAVCGNAFVARRGHLDSRNLEK